MKNEGLGFAGALGKAFVHSKLTPVIILVSLFLGVMAVILTPKEEEPQISVPMIDVMTPVPGFTAKEVEKNVTEVIERAVWGLDGVEYVYSTSQANGSLVTVRFKVGEPLGPSLVKIHHKLLSIRHMLPKAAMDSEVQSFSIDDVPFMVLTFTSDHLNNFELRTKVAPLARQLSSTPDLSRVELLGGQKRAVRVIVDPKKLSQRGVSLLAVAQTLQKNDALAPAGKNWSDTQVYDVEVGGRLKNASDVENIAIGQRAGRIVRIKDVAKVIDGAEELTRSSVLLTKEKGPQNAVSIVFAKKKGANVVSLAKDIIDRSHLFAKDLDQDVEMTVVRDYGSTAADKSFELIEHLLIATFSVTLLIALFMGIRASIVVAIAIPVTLALTLAIYYFFGYTLNRVTLFALIFSIGILVDDAIVVVENIERHLKTNAKGGIVGATIRAVSEVGNPTILATFTVIAAILPMAFVRGLMGPYMSPIPVGASFAMILSLFVAFIVTPWSAVKLLKNHHTQADNEGSSRLDRLYEAVMKNLLTKVSSSIGFGILTILLLVGAISLFYFKAVKVKMLPFDNKMEFQVTVDYPVDTPLSKSVSYSKQLASQLLKHKEVESVQVFAGESAPYSFSGMVKHTFLRTQDYQNDLQIVLTHKHHRSQSSHEIITELRPIIKTFGDQHNAITKVLEIPPGPPVLATMVAEVYGPDEETRKKVTKEVEDVFASVESVIDLDTSLRPGRTRLIYQFDQGKGGQLGTSATELMYLGRFLFSETQVTTLSDVDSPEDVGVVLSVDQKFRSSELPFAGLTIPSFESGLLAANEVLKKPELETTEYRHRKNLKPVSYVMSELYGEEEAPVYGILKLQSKIKYPLQTAEVPWNTTSPVVKWDGEWFITYEVFRDLGGAFGVVIILIYVLVLGWFRSFTVPLVIMAPIPISLIGIIPGHALFGSYFTATSMIGFIAGAGIIVRNSIILVDFIELQLARGLEVKEAVISAGVLRFRPMLLTAAAVVVGSSIMLADPIFQGLALSLIFGEVAATILSRFAVPIMYYWFLGKSRMKVICEDYQS